MAFGLNLITPPAAEPLTRTEAKLHLRVDTTDDDALIDRLITVARRSVETHTGRQLITATWDLALDGFPVCSELELPLAPLQSVTSITYYDTTGAATVWASSNYQVDTYGICGRVVPNYGVPWPFALLRPANGVIVRFVAGYGAANAVPDEIKAAMLLIIGHLYEHRESVVFTGGQTVQPQQLPQAVDWLLATYVAKGF